jgi:hypothetical protein
MEAETIVVPFEENRIPVQAADNVIVVMVVDEQAIVVDGRS